MENSFTLYKGCWLSKCPPHSSCYLKIDECGKLLNRGGYLLRNVYDWDCEHETSFWFVIKDSFGGMEELSSKMRNQVKKSLKTYDVCRVSASEMLRVGFPIFQVAVENYKVKATRITVDAFKTRIQQSEKAGNVDFWCVYTKETHKAVALVINTLHKDCCEYNTMKADPSYLRNSTYPYYGLIYEMNCYYLQELGFKYVSDGARSITEHSNIQSFLIDKFHFRKAYCQLQIVYQWWMKIAINILFPFRKLISVQSVKAILNMEAMRRNKY